MTAFYDTFRADPAKLAEAEEWIAGTFDGYHYAELTLAMYALAKTHPSHLIGSDVLTRLYRLAKVEEDAMDAKLMEMAEDAAEELRKEMEEARSEARAVSREAA
jgi:benzoyl-CoA reductase/2-hydroxyglutaryl-CoA dehydratase subunit BcrC/BadD/HgdB